MPLPQDEEVVKVSQGLVDTLRGAAGEHPGYRPAHARGIVFSGTFTPTSAASSLTKAPHFNSPTTPITVRFSSSGGMPTIPDTDPGTMPRGFALRFNLPSTDGRRHHTDIVSHSTPFFPTRTGADFLAFLHAAGAGKAPEFIASHPTVGAFLADPKPIPTSFAKERYFGVNAFKLTNADGKATFVRYRIVPELGYEPISQSELSTKGPSFLFDEIVERVGKEGAAYKLLAQVAEEGDVTDDATVHWPESRELVELGTIKLEALDKDYEKEQKYLIFDPIPRVDGIEPSDDPLLDVRAGVYLISGKQRRAAPESFETV